ncbi:MAG: hypothetical protein V4641_09960 [Pseudomonadota bacterium]
MSNIWSRLINLAGNITGVLGPANGGTGIANNAASTLTISGNFGTTATVTGTTTVTLPTTGTLLANSRNINTTAPITGGGDLTADRTIAISAIAQSTSGVDASAAQRLGTNTNDTANAGNIGERITQSRVRSAAISGGNTTVNTNVTGTALTLTAGYWRIEGAIAFIPSGLWTVLQAGISTTSATLSGTDTRAVQDTGGQIYTMISDPSGTSPNDIILTIPASYVALSGSTVFYLVSVATFSTGTNSVYGSITGTRVR